MTTSGMTTTESPEWAQVLDEFERSLGRFEEYLAAVETDAGTPQPDAWAPPGDIGAIPGHLRARAELLLERAVSIESLMTVKMASVAPSGQGNNRRRSHLTNQASSTYSTKL